MGEIDHLSFTHPKDIADFFKAIPILLRELEIGVCAILRQIGDLVARICQEHKLINALQILGN
jgi:hypothetical protein